MNLYVIKDTVAEKIGPLFEAENDSIAERNLANLIINAQGAMPKDFELWFVGTKADTIETTESPVRSSETATLVCDGTELSEKIDAMIEFQSKLKGVN